MTLALVKKSDFDKLEEFYRGIKSISRFIYVNKRDQFHLCPLPDAMLTIQFSFEKYQEKIVEKDTYLCANMKH